MKLGIIGIGNMGSGMAASLLRAGHEVTVYNRTPAKARPLVDQGAYLAGQISHACTGQAVLTMLADDHAVEQVVFGERGILKTLKRGAIHVSASTISVELSKKLANAHDQAGQRFVAAPVFGRPEMAAAGKLFVIVGGPDEAVEELRPVFEAIGQKFVRVNDNPQDANLVKLTGNFLIASVIESLGEAMALAEKAGIDRHQYLETLATTLFTSPLFTTYGALVADHQYEPAKFGAPLGEKDLRLTLAAAEALRVPMPLASLLHERLLALLASGGTELDWAALGQLAAKDAGLVLASK